MGLSGPDPVVWSDYPVETGRKLLLAVEELGNSGPV
jgi:hypothetical protein